jgi:hypothetical protein
LQNRIWFVLILFFAGSGTVGTRGGEGNGRRATVPRRGAWRDELGEAFLALLRETGNARAAARALGHPNLFNNRMRRHPEFRRACRAAVAEADARLSGTESGFPAPPSTEPFDHAQESLGTGIEVKSMPPGDGGGDGKGKRRVPNPYKPAPAEPLPTDVEALGGYLRPGRKRKPSRPQPVIRRNSQGRMQVTFAREGEWTEEIEDDFLARLRATGNFHRCALAVGFQPASVRERVKKWPAFARAVDSALEEASAMLDYKLVAYAHALLRGPGEPREEGEEDVPFDPIMAMKILSHIDARKYGRSGRGRGKGPPERTFQQACESILRKIEAIERHEAWKKARDGDPPGRAGA